MLIFQVVHVCAPLIPLHLGTSALVIMGIIRMEVPAALALELVPIVRQLALTVIVVYQHLKMHQVVSVIVMMVIIGMVQHVQLVLHHVLHVK